MATTLSPLSLTDVAQRRTSYLSDCGSSECSSVPSVCGSPTVGAPGVPSQAAPPCLPGPAGRPKPPRLGVPPAASALAQPRRGSGFVPPRPLCLDFLKGKCGRQRAYCRYYHPQPGEVTLTASPDAVAPIAHALPGTVHDPARPICEVWTLTGFCKYGPRCWKQHPQLSAQLAAPVAEPITFKFQNWLQGRQMEDPASPAAPAGRASAASPASQGCSEASFDTPPRSPLSLGDAGRARLRFSDTLARMRAHFEAVAVASHDEQSTTNAAPGAAPQSVCDAAADRPFVHQPYSL